MKMKKEIEPQENWSRRQDKTKRTILGNNMFIYSLQRS